MGNRKKITFGKRIFRKEIGYNVFAALIIFFYSAFFIGMTPRQMLISGVFTFVMVFIAQALLAPITHNITVKSVSNDIEEWKERDFTLDERTKLLKKVMSYPKVKGVETLVFFVVCAFMLFAANSFLTKIDTATNLISLFLCLFGAYNAQMLAVNFSERIASEYAKKIINQGVSEKEVLRTRVFNYGMKHLFIMYAVVPLIFTTAIAILVMVRAYIPSAATNELPLMKEQMLRMILVSGINFIVSLILMFLYYKLIRDNTESICTSLLKIKSSDVQNTSLIETDLSNELSFNMYLMNQTIILFKSIIEKTAYIGEKIVESVQDLVVVTNENSSTSVEQSAAVREILVTMEDADKLSQNIESKVFEVSESAEKNADDVQDGFNTLEINMDKMKEITESNIDTISGIRSLSDQIESIWEIVSIINSIADQTKIIAFNAELEAANAGEAGKNFHIVANEIRRLADRTTESTTEIQERITEIQHSSDKLIITSEGGTQKIQEGCELSTKLIKNFTNIKTSSENTVDSTKDIKNIIEQQTASFEQILITLKQIAASVENFSNSTQSVTESTVKLQGIAEQLSDFNKIIE